MEDDVPAAGAARQQVILNRTHPASNTADAMLADAALRDRQMFASIYQRYADQLYAYALARTGSTAVADDIVSDTMVEALTALERYDPRRGSLAAWLFTIAGRRIIDRRRDQSRFRRALSRLGKTETHSDDIADAAVRSDEARRVLAALADLPASDRELIILRYAADLNSTQIGEVLGLSAGAVRMRLSRVMKRLANQLGTDR